MSPLEATARAIAKHGGTEWDCDPSDPADVYMGIARAALTALRDNGVTQRMYDVAYDVRPSDNFDGIFRAMLDAALEGE
jgi:hypothetical protein